MVGGWIKEGFQPQPKTREVAARLLNTLSTPWVRWADHWAGAELMGK